MNTVDVLRYGQGTFLQAVESVAETDRDLPGACGIWSVRDLVAHIGSYELVLVDVLQSLAGETGTPHLDRMISLGPGFNDAEVDARRERSLPELLEELHDAHAASVRLVEGADPELLRRGVAPEHFCSTFGRTQVPALRGVS